jgi:hypothetical protein
MFILDSLLVSGLRWVLDTVATAADAEMNDDSALREQLLEAEMRREMGEISDEEFTEIEADILARIREIRERREGGSGPIAFGREEAGPSEFQVEATVSGDFHEPAAADSGTVIEGTLLETPPPASTNAQSAVSNVERRARRRRRTTR